jgi:hypothetical protein
VPLLLLLLTTLATTALSKAALLLLTTTLATRALAAADLSLHPIALANGSQQAGRQGTGWLQATRTLKVLYSAHSLLAPLPIYAAHVIAGLIQTLLNLAHGRRAGPDSNTGTSCFFLCPLHLVAAATAGLSGPRIQPVAATPLT